MVLEGTKLHSRGMGSVFHVCYSTQRLTCAINRADGAAVRRVRETFRLYVVRLTFPLSYA